MANYTYGVGGNILWDHANIDPPTHRWIAREFGWVPITFFKQMSRCAAAGHLSRPPATTRSPRMCGLGAAQPAALDVPGGLGEPLLPAAQPGARVRVARRPGARPARAGGLPGYTHLDVFFGRNAERDVFAHIVARTARNFQPPGGLESAERGLLWKPQHSTRRQVSVASRPAVRCCECGPTTSSWRSSGWASTMRSGRSTTAIASGSSPIPARCWAPSRADAEDVLQDVFLRAYGALRNDDRPVTLRAWLYRVAHNRCIDHLRRPDPPPAEIYELSRTPGHDPQAETARREDLRRLVQDVQRLPEQQRSALLMRELDGLTYAELADALDTSVPAIKSLLVRARVGLVEAGEARDTACVDIRADLVRSHGRGVRASGRSRRHLRDCDGCREYRQALRGVDEGLAALVPGSAGPLATVAKLLGIGGASSGAAAGAGAGAGGTAAVAGGATAATATATKVVAIVCCAAVVGGGAAEVRQYTSPVAPAHHAAHHARPAAARSAAARSAAATAPVKAPLARAIDPVRDARPPASKPRKAPRARRGHDDAGRRHRAGDRERRGARAGRRRHGGAGGGSDRRRHGARRGRDARTRAGREPSALPRPTTPPRRPG